MAEHCGDAVGMVHHVCGSGSKMEWMVAQRFEGISEMVKAKKQNWIGRLELVTSDGMDALHLAPMRPFCLTAMAPALTQKMLLEASLATLPMTEVSHRDHWLSSSSLWAFYVDQGCLPQCGCGPAFAFGLHLILCFRCLVVF